MRTRRSQLTSRFGPWFLEPVVAGLPTPTELDPNPKPYISTMDTHVSQRD